jgi:hypothetical protein
MKLISQMKIDGIQRPSLRCSCGELVLLPYQAKDDGLSSVCCNGCGKQYDVEVRIQGASQ